MKNNQIVTPSIQIPSTLPLYINETYREFVGFMEALDSSEERIGFSQNLLQNLPKYRDFDTYTNKVTRAGVLKHHINEFSEELELEDGFGFPDENGILYIDDEVILYRRKEGNKFLIFGTGKEVRAFTHIDDFISGFDKIFTKGKNNEIYNIGTTEKVTIAKLAKITASILSKKIKFKKNKLLKGSPSIRCPDINKIKKLGYKQKIRLKDGIKKVIN